VNSNCKVEDWKHRTIIGASFANDWFPEWLADAYATFHSTIIDKRYPCYFGSWAERNGALYYSYVCGGQIDHLPVTLQTFLSACKNISQDKNNLIVFFEPDARPATHSQHRTVFWDTLQYLRHHDPAPSSASYRNDPSDPLWEFPFAGTLFFVVGISPTYLLHRSRNLGPCLIMVFQPRQVFLDTKTAREISTTDRSTIRNRVQLWDDVQAHPDLNTYGHPGNLEWIQYFISDDNSRETGACPLSNCKQQRSSAHDSEDMRAFKRDEE
jgi:FPC/CPF motif-containing protein YcgG